MDLSGLENCTEVTVDRLPITSFDALIDGLGGHDDARRKLAVLNCHHLTEAEFERLGHCWPEEASLTLDFCGAGCNGGASCVTARNWGLVGRHPADVPDGPGSVGSCRMQQRGQGSGFLERIGAGAY